MIVPGETTTRDVEWWLRDTVHAGGYGAWFHPTCSVQSPGAPQAEGFSTVPEEKVIGHGDLIHVDFGIVHEGFCTDQQQHAYVLRPGEP